MKKTSCLCLYYLVMEQIGYQFKNDTGILKKELETANICFLHAPLFHPALKVVGPIRKNLGVRTFFNMLGPMVNPAFPKHQLVGVYNLEMARIYNYLLQQTESNFQRFEMKFMEDQKWVVMAYTSAERPSRSS